VKSDEFLHAALSREANLRRRLLTNVSPFQIPGVDRLIFVSDGGVVLYPTAPQKVEIIQNAVRVAQLLGIEEPRVALVAASDRVNPAVPSTMEASALVTMARQGQVIGGLVDGPLPLDAAMSAEVAATLGVESPVAGQADVLIAHDVEAGNIMGKGITYFAGGRMASIVVGAKVPLVLGSRADDHATRLACMALGVVLAARGYKEIWS
jgi:phosphate butyryltransferase